MGNLYKWGILEYFHSFPYKLTSINGEVGNRGPKRFRTQNNLYIWGFYAYFHQKMQNFPHVCVITWKIHSQSKNDKIQFLKFSYD